MPETVEVVYNNRDLNTSMPVEWYEEMVKNIDTSKAGTHEITGRVLDEHAASDDLTEISCTVRIEMLNYVANPSFEDTDTSMWSITYEGNNNPTDFQQKSLTPTPVSTRFTFGRNPIWTLLSNRSLLI